MVDCDASIVQKSGGLEPLAIGKVRGFGNLTNRPDPQAAFASDFLKGEAFREVLEGVLHAKVRKFGMEMTDLGWKCPADRGSRMPVYPASDCKGEGFRERRDGK